MEASKKILKAKSSIIINQPFFATILLSTPLTVDENIATMATDGDTIKYNTKFVDGLTLDEAIFVLSHEVLHCVLDHMGRRGSRTPNRYNQAADYVINELLVKDNIGSMPIGALYNPQLTAKGKGTTEGVYNLLPEKNEQKKAGDKGGALDEVHDAGTDNGTKPTGPATLKKKSMDRQVLINQAKNIAKTRGVLSSGLARLIDDFTKPVVDWREVLRNFISEKVKIETNWKKPKRRFLADNIYLPSLSGEKLGRITIAVDCSGSVDDILLKKFASEIQGIRDSLYPSKIDVIYFENKVFNPQTFEENEELILKAKGGGGTAFSPMFKHVNKQDETPLCVIVLTDLECDDYGEAPGYPVLWCVLEGVRAEYKKVPFGEVIEVEANNEN